MSGQAEDWNRNVGGGFGTYAETDEFYHGLNGEPGDSRTETWYWGFHVPDQAINCFAYCWVHPNLSVVTGGLMIYKGFKPQHLASELFDIRDFMSSAFLGTGSDIQMPNGFRVTVLKPLERMRMTFADPGRETSLDVELDAVSAPIMRANNKHFEQVMRVTGELVLRGEHHRVDCFQVRDRSWGELRPEDHARIPPYTWVTGVLGPAAEFSFNLGAHDDPEREPEWRGVYELPPASIVKDGWVVVGGEMRRLRRASKITRREKPLQRPRRHEIEIEDTTGRVYRITGEVVASSMWAGWPNASCHLGLVRWECEGMIGWGETQEVQWNDYVWRFGN